ncbi:MAG: hypothetical protein KDE34_20540 [Anaerolineales bacterium]|nr:hypothetical protein [Anaerolineales bacterium]
MSGETTAAHVYDAQREVAEAILTSSDGHQFSHLLTHMNQLPDSWLKYIYYEVLDSSGRITRWWVEMSVRPYIQGYGCDGTTDESIHAIANRLVAEYGIYYPDLLVLAYPDSYSRDEDFAWLTGEAVLGETFIPDEIDPMLALDDLISINNCQAADLLGELLAERGIISLDWPFLREGDAWEDRKKQAVTAYLNAIVEDSS